MTNKKNDSLAPTDKNRKLIPVSGSFLTQDGSGTPQLSPLTISDDSIVEIVIPENAVEVMFYGDNPILFSEDSGLTSSFRLPASSNATFGVAEMTSFFIKRAMSFTTNVNFCFVTI